MPRIYYERPGQTLAAECERDRVDFRENYVVAYDNPANESGVGNKKRIPLKRVVEVDG
jgi:hypothetical protein